MASFAYKYRGYLYAVLAHLGFLVIWQLAVVAGNVPRFIMPTPIATFETLLSSHYNWFAHIWATSSAIAVGYVLAVLVGVALAVLFVWTPSAYSTAMPLLVTLNMVPKVAMAPLIILWLGYGMLPNIVLGFIISFFPILLTTYRGLIEVEPDLLNLVKSLKGNRWQLFYKIQLPGSLPYLFSGMKVGAILAVAGVIVGEFIASDVGLGYFLLVQQNMLNTPAMMMSLILITMLGMILYGLVLLMEYVMVGRKV